MEYIISVFFQEDKNVKRQESRDRPRKVMRGLTVDSSHLGKLSNIPIREGFKKKKKKNREFSLTGGGGSPQFPTYFIYDFVKPWEQ